MYIYAQIISSNSFLVFKLIKVSLRAITFILLQIHTSRMTLADDVNLEEFVMTKDEFSGADIKAICTEAGLLALRERRMKVRAKSITGNFLKVKRINSKVVVFVNIRGGGYKKRFN